jgi:hypothetical protein
MANSFVHIIMYTYYAMSAVPFLRKYLWWKKYLTQLQMVRNVFSYSCIHVRAFFKNSSIEGGVLRKIDLTRRW